MAGNLQGLLIQAKKSESEYLRARSRHNVMAKVKRQSRAMDKKIQQGLINHRDCYDLNFPAGWDTAHRDRDYQRARCLLPKPPGLGMM